MSGASSIAPRIVDAGDTAAAAGEIWTGEPLDEKTFAPVRLRTVLEGGKWDAQVGDISTLAAFPLVMPRRVWHRMARWAELLSAEVSAAEEEIVQRPELLARLGLPWELRRVLSANTELSPSAGRVIRYDFHWTTAGWQISEANSDVPGGFSEGSFFTSLMAAQYPHLEPAGDPAARWSRALAKEAGEGGMVALLSAPGYMEDHQMVAFVAARLRAQGCRTHLARPEQIIWRDGIAHLATAWHQGPVAAMVRFYQAEWLSRLPRATGWEHFFRGGLTPVANPPLAIIAESKRFPLVWNRLSAKLPTWRALLPESCDPREFFWRNTDGWLLKTAYCNTGDTVSAREWLSPGRWRQRRWNARLRPGHWVAQRRFVSVPIATPIGPRHVCLGVYTVNGRAAGVYARLAEKPLVDYQAVDAALLLKKDDC